MSIRHIFGFDHIPLGAVDPATYFDTRLKFFVGEGSTQAATLVAGGWLSAGGGTAFQGLVPQVINDTPTHVVFGVRVKKNNTGPAGNTPIALYLNSAFTAFFTSAEVIASKLDSANGEYITLDINLVTGVVRRWFGNVELAPLTTIPVNTLKTAQYLLYIQAYNNSYASYQYRDFYIGDNFDGVDVNPLGDRVVRALPVKAAAGNNWVTTDAGPMVTALNKPWVAGALDVTASNSVDNTPLRVQFNAGTGTPDIDAVQVELAGSVSAPNTSIKVAREGDATGKSTVLSGVVKWGARSPVYSAKGDGSKISSADLASMNFDISGA